MIHKIPILRNIALNHMIKKYEAFPELLSIEVTNACNSKCIMCPRANLTRKIRHMSADIFNKIIEDCRRMPLKKINLFWFGDPLCAPSIIDYMRRIRTALPGVKLYISTNAELLTPERTDAILSEKLLDVINFDIDGMEKSTYEKIRIGVDFDRVIENVEYFMSARKKLGLKSPQTRVTIIKMDLTAGEIDRFVAKWSKIADKTDVNDYNTWLGTQKERNVGDALQRSESGRFTYPCLHPWNEMVIASDGNAGLCCLDYDLTAKLGNVRHESIHEIWHGAELKKFRNEIIKLNYSGISCCSRCNAHIYQDNSTWAHLWRKRLRTAV